MPQILYLLKCACQNHQKGQSRRKPATGGGGIITFPVLGDETPWEPSIPACHSPGQRTMQKRRPQNYCFGNYVFLRICVDLLRVLLCVLLCVYCCVYCCVCIAVCVYCCVCVLLCVCVPIWYLYVSISLSLSLSLARSLYLDFFGYNPGWGINGSGG